MKIKSLLRMFGLEPLRSPLVSPAQTYWSSSPNIISWPTIFSNKPLRIIHVSTFFQLYRKSPPIPCVVQSRRINDNLTPSKESNVSRFSSNISTNYWHSISFSFLFISRSFSSISVILPNRLVRNEAWGLEIWLFKPFNFSLFHTLFASVRIVTQKAPINKKKSPIAGGAR